MFWPLARNRRLMLPWLSLVAIVVALFACHAAPSPSINATPPANATRQTTTAVVPSPLGLPTQGPRGTATRGQGTLRVRVGERLVGGANLPTPTPAPLPVPTDTPGPFRGQASVRITPVGRPTDVVAEGTASDSTWTTFSVPAGHYWVFLPNDHQTTLANPSYASTNLPDGTIVKAWAEAIVPTGEAADVILVPSYGLP